MSQTSIYSAANIGLGNVLGGQSTEQSLKQMACAAQIAAPDTVRSLTERAHQAMEILDHELMMLGERLQPVREPVPCEPTPCQTQGPSYPEAIVMLRALVDRIESRAVAVRQVVAELRI